MEHVKRLEERIANSPLAPFIHFIAGFIAGVSPPFYSVMITLLFLIYEFIEKTIIHDRMYPEVREFTAGFACGVLLLRFS